MVFHLDVFTVKISSIEFIFSLQRGIQGELVRVHNREESRLLDTTIIPLVDLGAS